MSWLHKKCVLVPIDFSEHSFQAIAVAREFVEKNSDLHLIHVTHPWSEHEIGGSWGKEAEEERFQSILKSLRNKLQEMGYEGAKIVIHNGNAPVEITRYAEENDLELIVMPSHGRTGLKHFALGSVAERIVRKAHCPVLVLRKKEQKEAKTKKIIAYD